MRTRTRYRVRFVPALMVLASALIFGGILLVPQIGRSLERSFELLPWLLLGLTGSVLLTFASWWTVCYAEVERGVLRVSSLRSKRAVNLRLLASAEVHIRGRKKGRGRKQAAGYVALRLTDRDGRVVWVPLDVWADENVLLARIMRAAVDRRVRIDGEPNAVGRFTKLRESYKSWDRQQAAA